MTSAAGTPAGRSLPPRAQQDRSRATRERILVAATRLFIRDGYFTTTMASIAAEAGVAVQSLYLRFGSKLEILRAAFDVAIVGDLEPVPLLEREWFKKLREAREGRVAVGFFAHEVTVLAGRTYPIYAVIQAAAAGEAGDLLAEIKRQRYEGIQKVADELARKPGFSSGLSPALAADLIYGQASEEQFGLMVADRGWSPEAWERWLAQILVGALFPSAPEATARPG